MLNYDTYCVFLYHYRLAGLYKIVYNYIIHTLPYKARCYDALGMEEE